MRILSIETSCDETGISLVDASVSGGTYTFTTLANNLLSQAALHAEYGGVFPSLAKREHAKAIVPLIEKTLVEANLSQDETVSDERLKKAQAFLEREEETKEALETLARFDASTIDAIAVTIGPGLAPALWVGVNTARALAVLFDKPLIPVNHMHGHVFSALFPEKTMYELPALVLLVSGGHTELLSLDEEMNLTFLGGTRDDAIGEAFDKAARVLDFGYPGGPEISKAAQRAREKDLQANVSLPRPMLHDDSYDTSYSGLKTALLYHVRDNPIENDDKKDALAREFEDAALDVIVGKTEKAITQGGYGSLVVGGGVIANTELRRRLTDLREAYSIPLHLPEKDLTTDNSLMIAVAAYVATHNKKTSPMINTEEVKTDANLNSERFV